MNLNKPSKLPRWANNGGTITEPSEGKKDIGFIAEKPTFGVFNWLINLVYQWLEYFSNTVMGTEDGVISGSAKTSGFPAYLTAGMTTSRFTILGTATPLIVQIDGVRYTLSSDLLLGSDLSLAASSANTGTLGEGDGSAPTCYFGEYGGRIALSAQPGSNIEAAEAEIQAFKIINGANSEICLARYTTTQVADPGYHLGPLVRGVCGTDRQPVTASSTTIAILKNHWIFLNKDMETIKTTKNCPVYAATAPSGPSTDDFWFNTVLKSWARWNGSAWVYEGYGHIGYAVCDSAHCIGVECVDFQGIAWSETLSYKKIQSDRYTNDDYLRLQGPGSVNVAGTLVSFGQEEIINGGSTESGNGGWPWFYVYVKPDGTFVCSPKGPRKKDLRKGWYHPSEYWRCIGLYTRNAYSETHGHYDPNSGLCLMEYKNDIGSGEPGVFGFDFLTGKSIDSPSVSDVNYPNIPPIMQDFNMRIKAYATSGTPPNDIYLQPNIDSFLINGYIPIHTVGALNTMQTSLVSAMVECARPALAYFGNGGTGPLGYTTLKMHFGSGRIKF